MGPSREVTCYDGFIINGFRFHTKELESRKVTQNSGVLVQGCTFEGQERDYYGQLIKVVELEYYGEENSVFLFQCEWYDSEKGVVIDKYGITTIDTNSRHKPYEPFVIASQVVQVFYANPVSTKAKGWSTAITTKARNTYDVAKNSNEETYQEEEFHDFDLYNIEEQTQNLILLDDSQFAEEVDPSLPEAENEDRECNDEDEDDNDYSNDDEYSEEDDDI